MRRLLALCLLAGCGGEFSELPGIYQVTAATDNPAGCDVEGPSVLDSTTPFLFGRVEEFFGTEFLGFNECADLAACRLAAQTDDVLLSNYSFTEGSDADGWTSTSTFSFGSGGTCGGAVVTGRLTKTAMGIRIESRTQDVEFQAAECTTDGAEAAAEGTPCDQLATVDATFVEAL